jgi:hypothetical protein
MSEEVRGDVGAERVAVSSKTPSDVMDACRDESCELVLRASTDKLVQEHNMRALDGIERLRCEEAQEVILQPVVGSDTASSARDGSEQLHNAATAFGGGSIGFNLKQISDIFHEQWDIDAPSISLVVQEVCLQLRQSGVYGKKRRFLLERGSETKGRKRASQHSEESYILGSGQVQHVFVEGRNKIEGNEGHFAIILPCMEHPERVFWMKWGDFALPTVHQKPETISSHHKEERSLPGLFRLVEVEMLPVNLWAMAQERNLRNLLLPRVAKCEPGEV